MRAGCGVMTIIGLILVTGACGCHNKATPGPSSARSSASAPVTATTVNPVTPATEDDLLARVPQAQANPAPRNTEPQFPKPESPVPAEPIATATPTRQEIKTALEDIRIAIDNNSLATGRMPSPAFTLEIVRQAAPKYASLILSGAIVLHPARSREEVWAYEAKSDRSTVYVLFAMGVEELNQTELRRRLGR